MITSSELWKRDLLDRANNLRSYYNQSYWDLETEHDLEKLIFLGFFAMRKLIECKLVDSTLCGRQIKLREHMRINDTYMDSPNQFPKSYDLMDGRKCTLTYKSIAHQFVHSFHFGAFVPSGQSLVGFYFASDREKKDKIYYLRLIAVIEAYESIAKDKSISLDVKHDGSSYCIVDKTKRP